MNRNPKKSVGETLLETFLCGVSSMSTLYIITLIAGFCGVTSGGFQHGFSDVNHMMWGWLGAPFSPAVTQFYAATYDLIVLSSGSRIDWDNITATKDWDLYSQALELRRLNPNVKILLYEATQWGTLGQGPTELKEHPEYWLRDDNGVPYHPLSMDFRVKQARQWWIEMIQQAQAGKNTRFLFDGLLVDSGSASIHVNFNDASHTMSAANQRLLIEAKMQMLAEAQDFYTRLNGGRVLSNPLLNWGVIGFPGREAKLDFPVTYHWQFVEGALDEMFGGFSSLQGEQGFGNRTGLWNATTMNISMTAMLNLTAQNKTVLVRGYPGPCGVPFTYLNTSDPSRKMVIPSYPALYPVQSPVTLAEARNAAGSDRFITQALAPFLIVANRNIWWSYAWFYSPSSGWYPCTDDSCVGPAEWYPLFSKPLGEPISPPTCTGGFKWTRKYAHAQVFVDLEDPSAARITWM